MIYLLVFLALVIFVVVTSYTYINRVVTIGFLYYIFRDNGSLIDPVVCKAFMNQLCEPWRKGKGVQFRFKTYTFQVGVSKKHPGQSDDQGVLSAVGGRYLDTDTQKIREW